MKTITTISLLLCSIVVYGQKKAKTSETISLPTIGTSEYFKGYSGGMSGIDTMTPPKIQGYYFQLSNTKTVIRANYPDSTGLVKVWLNRKEITWTSDSTFTYKTDQK